jgi:hypothetical protein
VTRKDRRYLCRPEFRAWRKYGWQNYYPYAGGMSHAGVTGKLVDLGTYPATVGDASAPRDISGF